MRRVAAALLVLIVLAAVALVLFARGAIGGDAVRRALEQQLSARLGEPVAIGSLGSSFFPRVTLDLHDIAIGQPVTATIAEVSIATGLRGLLSKRVEDAEMIVSNSRLTVPMALALAGAVAQSGPATPADGVAIVSVRALVFRHVTIVAEPHSLTVDLESSLVGDRLDVARLTAESAGTKLQARGTMTSLARREGTFTATAGTLNLDELLGVVAALTHARGPGAAAARTAVDMNVTVDLTSPGGMLGGYSFEKLASTVRITDGRLLLEPLRFGMFGGNFDGRLQVVPSGRGSDLTMIGRLAGIDVARLLRETNGSTSMTGTLGGTVSLSSSGSSAAEIVRGGRGSGQIAITNGVIPGLEMVRSIVLAFGKPSGAPPPGSGSAFSRLAGHFTVADQVLRSHDITFASRDFDMAGEATVRLPSGAIAMRANVVLSAELTAQAGTDLRRYAQEDGRVVVPAMISGTVARPSVSIDIAAAVNRALQNELKRKLNELFKRIIR